MRPLLSAAVLHTFSARPQHRACWAGIERATMDGMEGRRERERERVAEKEGRKEIRRLKGMRSSTKRVERSYEC